MNQRTKTDAVVSAALRLVTRETAPPPETGVVGRLLLTPALRVEETEGEGGARPRRTPSALELRIAELERAMEGEPTERETDAAEASVRLAEPVVVEPRDTAVRDPGTKPDAPAGPPVRAGAPATAAAASAGPGPAQGPDAGEGPGALPTAGLEDLVADAVRAEFEGEFGELVTRRVRRLVRREVNRILASKGFGQG